MPQPGNGDDSRAMTRDRYAALWWENGSAPLAGLLQVGLTALRFEGRSTHRQALRRIGFDEIRSLHLARGARERVLGRPAIVLDIGRRDAIRIATPEPGALHELLDVLTRAASP
jgi:hypothetical protein